MNRHSLRRGLVFVDAEESIRRTDLFIPCDLTVQPCKIFWKFGLLFQWIWKWKFLGKLRQLSAFQWYYTHQYQLNLFWSKVIRRPKCNFSPAPIAHLSELVNATPTGHEPAPRLGIRPNAHRWGGGRFCPNPCLTQERLVIVTWARRQTKALDDYFLSKF